MFGNNLDLIKAIPYFRPLSNKGFPVFDTSFFLLKDLPGIGSPYEVDHYIYSRHQ